MEYSPKFLIEILNKADRNSLKECACKMITKLFGDPRKNPDNGFANRINVDSVLNLMANHQMTDSNLVRIN